MVSKKIFSFKKVLITIIAILLSFSLISFIATKIVYDNIFDRCDKSVYENEYNSSLSQNRQEFIFKSGENNLKGYLYGKDNGGTLIIFATGFKADCSSYLPQIETLVSNGFGVFIFDPTGAFCSSGNSSIGFSQQLLDLKCALDFTEENSRFGFEELALLGHSRGGYSVCCALSFDYDISAVISVSGINSAMEGVVGSSVNYIGNIAYANYGFLWLYQSTVFENEILSLSAYEEISNSNVPVLIVHGAKDTTVPIDKFSIYSHKDKINSENASYYICTDENSNGHTDLLFDSDGTSNDKLMKVITEFLISSTKS